MNGNLVGAAATDVITWSIKSKISKASITTG